MEKQFWTFIPSVFAGASEDYSDIHIFGGDTCIAAKIPNAFARLAVTDHNDLVRLMKEKED